MTLLAVLFLISGAATAGDVLEETGHSIVINWTTMTILVTEEARGFGTESSTRAVEQLARQQVGPGVMHGAGRVRVDKDTLLSDLFDRSSLADPVQSRIARWHVSESRYFASGKVALVGELSLLDALKPLVLGRAVPRPQGREQPRYTGLVVDAREAGLLPCYLPVIRSHSGEVLFSSVLWEDSVLDRTPVIYVADPADRASARAGESPLFVRGHRSDGTEVVLDKTESLRFKTAIQGADVLGEGRVVIVVGNND